MMMHPMVTAALADERRQAVLADAARRRFADAARAGRDETRRAAPISPRRALPTLRWVTSAR